MAAVDIDEAMTNVLDTVERDLRNAVADGLTEILTAAVDEAENSYDADEPQEYADELTDEDGKLINLDDAHTLLHDGWVAGWDAAIAAVRNAVDSGKYTGWRPIVKSD